MTLNRGPASQKSRNRDPKYANLDLRVVLWVSTEGQRSTSRTGAAPRVSGVALVTQFIPRPPHLRGEPYRLARRNGSRWGGRRPNHG